MSTAAPAKKSRFRPRLMLLVLFLVACIPAAVWYWRTPSHWRIRVLDKTVPHPDYREHAALTWAFNYWRALSPTGGLWDATRDYVGYHPGGGTRSASDLLLASHLEGANALFITDTYGVYSADQAEGDTTRTGLDYSKKLYGGLTPEEASVVEAFVQRGGNLIAEFNTFASPTESAARRKMETLLGLRWTDWSGRYFEDLADEGDVPVWARRNWLSHHGAAWAFHGPGYMFVNEDSRIEVLTVGKDVQTGGLRLKVTTPGDPLMKGCAADVPFRYWFDIVESAEDTEVLARYELQTTSEGSEILQRAGLPRTFPAVMRAAGTPLRLYWAGDFSDNVLARGPFWYAGWPRIRRWIGFEESSTEQDAFFWGLLVPMSGNLLRKG